MTFDPAEAAGIELDRGFLDLLIREHVSITRPSLERLWSYYRNEQSECYSSEHGGRKYRLAQERGLQSRLTGRLGAGVLDQGQPEREIVIENDIAWRVHTLVDFMFGRPAALQSCASDKRLASLIEFFLHQVFESNGGVGFFQDMALLGSVYGYVDVLVRADQGRFSSGRQTVESVTESQLMGDARGVVLELIEAPRAIAVLDPDDYRRLNAYVLHYRRVLNTVEDEGALARACGRVFGGGKTGRRRASIERTQVWTDHGVATFEDSSGGMKQVDQWVNPLGRLPLVHIQNLPQPFTYSGLSEVEPLIPLQDELNTRLSDRANRVTFQSFKMYLGKGIEQFTDRAVGPGQMWATDNPDASIQEFGGDSHNPSEDAHINEIREAMDKTSAVTPVAAGLVRDRLGNLTSANALRVTLMGLLAKTEKKRVTYGAGIQKMCELILHAADVFGILPNRPEDRRVRIDWPGMLPEDDSQRLRDAQIKLEIGVSAKQVLTELGYGDCPETV
jgi:hypothetical protein